MSSKIYTFSLFGEEIEYIVNRGKRKRIYLQVADGKLEIKVPLKTSDAEIQIIIANKLRWIYNNIKKYPKKERIKFWNHVAFYNYVQEPILRTRMAPTQEQYDNSVDAFLSLIKICQPQAVIAWGLRLYNNLPNPKQIKGEMGRYINTDADDSYETWNYYLEDKIIPVIGIYHPSSAFDWMYWNQIITKFLNHE